MNSREKPKNQDENPKPTARHLKATARFTKGHLNEFKDLLRERRKRLAGSYERLDEAKEGDGESSAVPLHMADVGSDTFEKDMALGLMETERKELQEINEALGRIETGTFGACESCKKPIPLARLRAIPYARLCIECKQKEESFS